MRTHNHCQKPVQQLCGGIVALALAVLITLQAFAAEPLRIVTFEVQPFGFLENGKPTGLHYELSNLIAERAGLLSTNRLVPYARVMQEFEDGRADLVMIYRNDAMQKTAVPVTPVITHANIIVGRAGTRFSSLNDLHGKTVAQLRGAVINEAFSADEAIQKFYVTDYVQSMKMLLAGRLDAAIGPDIGLYSALKALGATRKELGEPLVLATNDAYLHLSKTVATDELIAALQQAVKAMQEDGTIAAVRERYIAPE